MPPADIRDRVGPSDRVLVASSTAECMGQFRVGQRLVYFDDLVDKVIGHRATPPMPTGLAPQSRVRRAGDCVHLLPQYAAPPPDQPRWPGTQQPSSLALDSVPSKALQYGIARLATPTHGEFFGKLDHVLKFLAAIKSAVSSPAFARPLYRRDEAIHLPGDIVRSVCHARRSAPESPSD